MKGTCYAKGHIYFHICSVNQATADQPPSISLCPTRRAPLSSYWMLTMSTPAPVAADPLFGPWPSLMMVLAHRPGTQLAGQTSRHLLGVDWAMALKSLAACSDLLLDTSRFFPPHLSPHRGTLFYRLSAGLIRADMPSVLGWTDIAFAGVCACVCVGCCCSLQAVRDAFCIISSRVKGYSNKCLNAIAKFLD